MSRNEVQVNVEADDRISVDPPRTAESVLGTGVTVMVPWYVRIGNYARLTFADEAKLIEFRDAITAALDERGVS